MLGTPISRKTSSMTNKDPHTLADQLATLSPELRRRARGLTRSAEDASDLAQETVLRLWALHRAGTRIRDARALAGTILTNLARSQWRDLRQYDQLEEDTIATEPDAPRVIACHELEAAIEKLPAAQSELLHHVERGETSPARLADLTGHPVGTVMSRLARARANLRLEMGMSRACSVTSLYDEPAHRG